MSGFREKAAATAEAISGTLAKLMSTTSTVQPGQCSANSGSAPLSMAFAVHALSVIFVIMIVASPPESMITPVGGESQDRIGVE